MHDERYRCSRCGEDKPASEFSPDRRKASGLQARCKTCGAEVSRQWRRAHPNEQREQGRKKYAKIRAERPEAHRRRIADWRARNLEHARAQTRAGLAVRKALLRGEMTRPDTCSACGSSGPIEGHHADYTKPLEVEWLCRICHRAADKRRKHASANTELRVQSNAA